VPTLDRNSFLKLPVAVPEIDQQIEIAEVLSLVESNQSIIEKKKKTLSDLFRTLLHQLMTAQIRVNDIDLSELGIETEPIINNGVENGRKAGALS